MFLLLMVEVHRELIFAGHEFAISSREHCRENNFVVSTILYYFEITQFQVSPSGIWLVIEFIKILINHRKS
jgi:uncharacterized membrane protein